MQALGFDSFGAPGHFPYVAINRLFNFPFLPRSGIDPKTFRTTPVNTCYRPRDRGLGLGVGTSWEEGGYAPLPSAKKGGDGGGLKSGVAGGLKRCG